METRRHLDSSEAIRGPAEDDSQSGADAFGEVNPERAAGGQDPQTQSVAATELATLRTENLELQNATRRLQEVCMH